MKIANDIGGSRRLTAVEGSDKIDIQESRYREIQLSANVFKNMKDKGSELDDFTILKSPRMELNGKRFVKGEPANYHTGEWQTCDNAGLKSNNNSTYINTSLGFAKALSRHKDKMREAIKCGFCLPASEFYKTAGAETLKDNIKGDYSVKFNITGEIVNFSIDRGNIVVVSEGMAAVAALMKKDPVIAAKLLMSNLLIIDPGFRSTEIMIVRRGLKELGGSARSFPIGGITIQSRIEDALEAIEIPAGIESVEDALISGKVSDNNGTMDVSNIVREVKMIFARTLENASKKVLSAESMSIKEIQNLLILGRCFTHPKKEAETTGDVRDMLKDELWGDYNLGVIEPDDLGTANVLGVLASL